MSYFDLNKIKHQLETVTLDDGTEMERVWIWVGYKSSEKYDYVDIPFVDERGLPTTPEFRKNEIRRCYRALQKSNLAEQAEAKAAQLQESQEHLYEMEMIRQAKNESLQALRPTAPTPQHVARDIRSSKSTNSHETILANARRAKYNGSSHGSSRGSSHGSSMLPRQRLRLSAPGVNQSSHPSSTDASRPTIDTGSTDSNNNDLGTFPLRPEEVTYYQEIESNADEDDSTNDSTAANSRPLPPRMLSPSYINQNRVRFGVPMPTSQHFQVPRDQPNVQQIGQ